MSLSIETGHPLTKDVQRIDGKSVRFVDKDGRTMFEVYCCADGRTIEVRGVESSKHAGVIYDNTLSILPKSGNVVHIQQIPFDDVPG